MSVYLPTQVPPPPAGAAEMEFIVGDYRVSAREDVGRDGRFYVLYRTAPGQQAVILTQSQDWKEVFEAGMGVVYAAIDDARRRHTLNGRMAAKAWLN